MPKLATLDRRLSQLMSWRGTLPLLAAGLIASCLWVMTRNWDASLLDRYQFRQTQTALTAFWLQQDGFSLAYPLPIFGPPWSVPHEFPFYQWLVAAVAQITGTTLLSAARAVSIVCFLAMLPAVYGLAAAVESDPRRRLLVPAAVLTTPVCLFYARTFMIESCACALAVWFLYAQVRNLRHADWRWTLTTSVLGVSAALVKVTTFALFGTVAVVITARALWGARSRPPGGAPLWRLTVTSAVPALASLAATVWWVAFSDRIKLANPYSVSLTSGNLRPWLYGTLAQRTDPAFWQLVGHEFSIAALSGWLLLLLALGLFLAGARYRRAALVWAAGFLLGPLYFSNLYYVHEYYYFPSAVFLTAAAGLVLAGIVASPRLGGPAKTALVAAFFVLQAVNFSGYYAFTLRNRPNPPPPLAAVIRQAVPKDGIVLVHGWDWNTLLPYYAERRAILVPMAHEENADSLLKVLDRIPAGQVCALVIHGPHQHDPAFVHWRTELLNLAPTPVATSIDGDLYLSFDASARLAGPLGDLAQYPGVSFNFAAQLPPPDPRLHRQAVDPAAYAAVAAPAPFAVFNPWSVDVAPLEGKTTIFANAPSELHFHAPAGATRIEAIVGLNDGSYVGPHPTDGVDVVIFELLANGQRRILYRRYLDPVHHTSDRGPQAIVLEHLGRISGAVVFAVYPGPNDNLACDWSYWRQIRIH